MSPKKVCIKTFGCQMNVADSETMLSSLLPLGYRPTDETEHADLVVVNTCSIREKAEQKLRSFVGRLLLVKQKRPNLKIAIAGCMAQRAGQDLAKRMPEVDIVLGPDQVTLLPSLLEENMRLGKTVVSNTFDHEDLLFEPNHRSYRAKASGFVPIMKGCDHKCTYCIVPYTRGIEKSRLLTSIIDEISYLIQEKRLKEITLVGQNVNGYGRGSAFDFPKLLWRLAQIPGLKRLRFTTSHPKDCTQEFANCFRDLPEVCPYLHLPVQSGSNKILKRMKRQHTHEWYRERIAMLREAQPNIALSTDIIVGFPGETDEDFADTLQLVQDIEYDFAYSFMYSERPGTPAARLQDDIPLSTKKARLHCLQASLKEFGIRKSRALVGTSQEILVDQLQKDGDVLMAEGYTGTFKRARFPAPLNTRVQDLLSVQITTTQDSRLVGVPVQPLDYSLPSTWPTVQA